MGRPRKIEGETTIEESKEVQEVVSNKPTLTPEQQAIASRIASDDKEWETISEESLVDFSFGREPYPLPLEAKKLQDDHVFVFRFIEAKMERIDEVRNAQVPEKWWLCNATNTPFLAKYCDPAHGGVQVRDQILVFKPYWMHKKYQEAKNNAGQSKNNTIDKRNGIKADYGEWVAGEQHKIAGTDVVMASDE